MKIPKFYGYFTVQAFQFPSFYEKRPNMANATLREVWSFRSKMRKTTRKTGVDCLKLTLFAGK